MSSLVPMTLIQALARSHGATARYHCMYMYPFVEKFASTALAIKSQRRIPPLQNLTFLG